MNRVPAAYRAASLALAAPFAGHALYRAWRDGGRAYLLERYGFARGGLGDPVWIHCASVGEVATAEPLVRALRALGVGPLLVSTTTPTGQRRARERLPFDVARLYLPVDRPGPVRRFLERNRPRLALILETELWPHLYSGLAREGIPLVLVNARLSRRTTQAPAWWRRTAGWCLRGASAILARSDADRARMLDLGAVPGTVRTVGNLKLAAAAGPAAQPIRLGRAFVLAASTHHDEELRLARAWRDRAPGDRLLAIAPRHPERGAAIAAALHGEGIATCRRSRGEAPGDDAAVYLADTLGELDGLMAASDAVIMGGSFIPRGGQNVLEAARAGRAIVTGPHMHNFADEAERLEAAGALLRATDARSACEDIRALLADPPRCNAMGAAGRSLLDAEADMAVRYVTALQPWLDSRPPAPRGASGPR